MNERDLAFLSIAELPEKLANRELSSNEAVEVQLQRLDDLDPHLNAYITVLADRARDEAAAADERRRRGEDLPLLGVPIALKDLFAMAGVRMTAGSRVLFDHVPAEDATVVRRLREAGAVILGKTNMMEFAYGYPHPDFGETRNPWALDRTAGGSSGGSAAAVAAGIAYGALGSDTGGSIRSPAAYCGIVGLKPTYGSVSRAGVVPLSWSLDHAGPLTRTVRDAAILFDVLAGYDPSDPASARHAHEPTAGDLDGGGAGLRIGVVEELFERHVEPEVRQVATAALEPLAELGFQLQPVQIPDLDMVGPAIMPILQAEATSYHWPTMTKSLDAYGLAIRENLLLGATVLAKDYLQAQRLRRQIGEAVRRALERVDMLLFPTQPIIAPSMDSYEVAEAGGDDVLDVEIGHTGLANLTGHPALSVPCGFTPDGLPVGLQFTGRHFDERTILQVGHRYESSTAWHRMHPDLH
jgi:aspartyl-tRNA(Asn)/glutamyl-tRNA(Gln) amidotransferase subunit A